MTATDTTTVPDVDLTRDVPCEWNAFTCHTPATWLARQTCCGIVATLCDGHRSESLDSMASTPFFKCADCGAHHTPHTFLTWRPL